MGALLFVILGVLILIYCYINVNKNQVVTVYIFCCVFFSIMAFASATYLYCNDSDEIIDIYSFIAVIIAFICFLVGYNIAKTKKQVFNYSIVEVSKFNYRVILLILLSAAALYLYSQQYGGIAKTMILGNAIRSNNAGHNSMAFLKHFIPVCVTASVYLFSYIYLSKNKIGIIRRTFMLCLLGISTILTIMYILANDGRLMVGYFLLAMMIVVIKFKVEYAKVNLFKYTIITLLGFFFVWSVMVGSEKIMREQAGGTFQSESRNFVESFGNELSFVERGFEAAVTKNDSYMIYNDVINGIFAWLPTSLKPIKLEDVWDYNTRLIDSTAIGQFPCSLIAQSYYDLNIIGLFIIPFLYGIFIRLVEKILTKKDNIFAYSTYILCCLYLGKAIMYFSMYNIMMNIFFIVISWIVMEFKKKPEVQLIR